MLNPKPKLVQQNQKNLWEWLSDAEFARQRLQGKRETERREEEKRRGEQRKGEGEENKKLMT